MSSLMSSLSLTLPKEPGSNAFVEYARTLYSHADVQLSAHQGGCSVTLVVKRSFADRPKDDFTVLQMRPVRFAVDVELMQQARQCHADLIPVVLAASQRLFAGQEYQILEMSWLSGVGYDTLQRQQLNLEKLERLVAGLADVFARSWHFLKPPVIADGRISRSLPSRLQKLSLHLPDGDLRRLARQTVVSVESGILQHLPVVLTHGDLLPSNLLVNDSNGELTGVIDWAEAEYLPFGLALYGLDHLLGFMSTSNQFVYHNQSKQLRQLFWRQLIQQVTALADTQVLQAVMLARTVGVLLWHGYAWDDGKIERVIDAECDAQELAYLRAFLQADYKSLL